MSWIDDIKRCPTCGIALDLNLTTVGDPTHSGANKAKCDCPKEEEEE